jgi:hypothetical protein
MSSGSLLTEKSESEPTIALPGAGPFLCLRQEQNVNPCTIRPSRSAKWLFEGLQGQLREIARLYGGEGGIRTHG